VPIIEWTFDPLVRRNAYFNLMKLGAAIAGFEPDFYGEMPDAINAGDHTDRAVIEWEVDGERPASPDGGVVILEPDAGGRPVVHDSDAAVLRAWIPEDAVALRRADAAAGRAWRLALRESFGTKIRSGYAATSMRRDGWYTLVREQPS
jgi:predicted GNAT superfamily acetyltransferase